MKLPYLIIGIKYYRCVLCRNKKDFGLKNKELFVQETFLEIYVLFNKRLRNVVSTAHAVMKGLFRRHYQSNFQYLSRQFTISNTLLNWEERVSWDFWIHVPLTLNNKSLLQKTYWITIYYKVPSDHQSKTVSTETFTWVTFWDPFPFISYVGMQLKCM